MKVVALRTCYTKSNVRVREGQEFHIKDIDAFSCESMGIKIKGGGVKQFSSKDEVGKFVKKGAKNAPVIDEPAMDEIETEEPDQADESTSTSNDPEI